MVKVNNEIVHRLLPACDLDLDTVASLDSPTENLNLNVLWIVNGNELTLSGNDDDADDCYYIVLFALFRTIVGWF